MSVECWVIIVLILANGSYYHAARHTKTRSLDFAHGAGSLWIFNRRSHFPLVGRIFPFDQFRFVPCVFTLIALVFACVLFGMLAGNMGGKATRRVYMFLCGGFSVILSIVLIHSIRPF